MKTLYDEILDFDAMDRSCGGQLVEPKRRPWHDAAVGTMLQAQLHITATQKRFTALGEQIDACIDDKKIIENFHEISRFLTLPAPVCWTEVLNEEHHFRQGFVLQEMPEPALLKLYTFQQRLSRDPSQQFLPSVVGVQTTLCKADTGSQFMVEKGGWLPDDEYEIGAKNMQKLAKFVLAVNPDFDGFQLVFEDGSEAFAKQARAEPEKIIAANREKRFPFFELPYVKGEPDLPSMRFEGPASDGPKVH